VQKHEFNYTRTTHGVTGDDRKHGSDYISEFRYVIQHEENNEQNYTKKQQKKKNHYHPCRMWVWVS